MKFNHLIAAVILFFCFLSTSIAQNTNSIAPSINWKITKVRVQLASTNEKPKKNSSPHCKVEISYQVPSLIGDKVHKTYFLTFFQYSDENKLSVDEEHTFTIGSRVTLYDGLNGTGGTCGVSDNSKLSDDITSQGMIFVLDMSWYDDGRVFDNSGAKMESYKQKITLQKEITIPWQEKFEHTNNRPPLATALTAKITWLRKPSDDNLQSEAKKTNKQNRAK